MFMKTDVDAPVPGSDPYPDSDPAHDREPEGTQILILQTND